MYQDSGCWQNIEAKGIRLSGCQLLGGKKDMCQQGRTREVKTPVAREQQSSQKFPWKAKQDFLWRTLTRGADSLHGHQGWWCHPPLHQCEAVTLSIDFHSHSQKHWPKFIFLFKQYNFPVREKWRFGKYLLIFKEATRLSSTNFQRALQGPELSPVLPGMDEPVEQVWWPRKSSNTWPWSWLCFSWEWTWDAHYSFQQRAL